MYRAAALVLTLLALSLAPPASTALADDFGTPVAGQHVYDRAGVLAPDEIRMLERKAANLEASGAPTILYLQVKSATLSQAKRDARDLMDAWDVQSAAGSRDGFVMLFDLEPGATQHGQAGLFAGRQHAGGGFPRPSWTASRPT
jgi:uncharacterized membrane protein YgcG